MLKTIVGFIALVHLATLAHAQPAEPITEQVSPVAALQSLAADSRFKRRTSGSINLVAGGLTIYAAQHLDIDSSCKAMVEDHYCVESTVIQSINLAAKPSLQALGGITMATGGYRLLVPSRSERVYQRVLALPQEQQAASCPVWRTTLELGAI